MPPPRPLLPLLPLLLLALARASPLPPTSPPPNFSQRLGGRARRPAQIGTSFVQTSLWDLEGDAGDGKTTCEIVVDRSKNYNTNALAIVVTVEARGYEAAGLDQYFYKEASGAWSPTTSTNIERFRSGLERCAKYALSQGFTSIHLLPHVDPQEPGGKGLWRNTVRFDPTKQTGPSGEASSYEEAALLPAAKALGAAAASLSGDGDKLSVDFSLGGEQGMSVFTYPRNYQSMVPRLRQAMVDAAGGEGSAGAKKLGAVEFGVSMNWGKACGCVEVTEQDPLIYNATFPDRLARWRKGGGEGRVDISGVKNLIEGLDWLGTSGYASLPADAGAGADPNARGAAALEASWETLAYEMGLMGISLQESVLSRGKRMIYSEQGLGGCDRKGNVAPDAAWVAKNPFLGLWPNHGGMTNSARNGAPAPIDPWKKPEFTALRRQVYNYFADWAAAGGGPQYRLDAAYVWSAGTWDVHAAHPVSGGGGKGYNAGPLSYGDAEIQDKIRRTNAVANAAGSYSVAAPPSGEKNSAAERARGAQAAIDEARVAIPGTKASSDAWLLAARAAAGVPAAAAAAAAGEGGAGDKAASNGSSSSKAAANGGNGSNKAAPANNGNNKPAANSSSGSSSSKNANKPAAANSGGGSKGSPNKAAAGGNKEAQAAKNKQQQAAAATEKGRRTA